MQPTQCVVDSTKQAAVLTLIAPLSLSIYNCQIFLWCIYKYSLVVDAQGVDVKLTSSIAISPLNPCPISPSIAI